ncbi:ABC transporter permease [Rhodocytophaga aerolata]|uniref:ABC transporter permease n=1 Tax=Rhodocytophaga aerolata TaxID=455078 RepID=A0ABT8QXU4_9BACT|nr:ABC transporter permease [Rhodocytophaga aerolata]MDO1444659.1 ABC transporter permease [Rhodocytophaga aerolata]
MNNKLQPPSWIDTFLQMRLPQEQFEEVQGDMHELYVQWVSKMSKSKANRMYLLNALTFLRPLPRRNKHHYSTLRPYLQANFFDMLFNYLIIALRNLIRQKAFSLINIFGLAISMSVGLLIITMISDTFSLDNFHQKKDRIYGVITTDQVRGQPAMHLASSSVRAGKQIGATVPGVESVTLLRRGFGGDATIKDTKISLSGLWASESFFQVFTFPLLQGDPATALIEPYSLVLTEKTAKKLFGQVDVLGQQIKFDTLTYIVTGVMKDVPKLSHIQFEALVSFATVELQKPDTGDGDFFAWENIYMNYAYLLLSQNANPQTVQVNLDQLSAAQNASFTNRKITLSLLPIANISTGERLVNPIGPTFFNNAARWVLAGLALIVILSACFNYTNLSIARALRRSKEVGIRKMIGAAKSQVLVQFIMEAIVISLFSLIFSFLLFLLLRTQFLSLASQAADLFRLELSAGLVVYFVIFAILVGITAGILPALFFSRINAIQVLKNASLKLFYHIALRKILIVIQYTFSLIFITTTIIGFNQYKSFLTYDLGFSTENILNIPLQGNSGKLLKNELTQLPAVQGISTSMMVSSLGSLYGGSMKYKDPVDSANVWMNHVDEYYLPLHEYTFLAGKNFNAKANAVSESEIIVNEQVLNRFDIGKREPEKALGEVLTVQGKKLTIIGVVKDFHYGTLDKNIEPTILRYSNEPGGYLNVKIRSTDLPATLANIKAAWKKIDRVHPLEASFYDDQIEQAYNQYSVMIKIIGFLSFLAISIASVGLFGMIVYSTETRLKEISIRKVLGASESSLIYQLSKGFLALLLIAAFIALPVTYLFFNFVVLREFVYHQPIGISELLLGVGVVMLLAIIMIGSQTLKAARNNPVNVLRNE